MKFDHLKIVNWRQFKSVDIKFHPRMTIITGTNGAGKTTLMRLLAQHFGWQNSLLATPMKKKGKGFRYSITQKMLGRFLSPSDYWRDAGMPMGKKIGIGFIGYSDDTKTPLMVTENHQSSYGIEIPEMNLVYGLNIASHRPQQNYLPIDNIPVTALNAAEAYHAYSTELTSRYNGDWTGSSPIKRMKEALIAMAMFGQGNEHIEGNYILEQSFRQFTSILRNILPPSIGFHEISIRIPDVVLVTRTGEFMIDSASGGLMSLIDLAWQIFLYSQDKKQFTVLLDEPENHLHPSMQRTLLIRLMAAFPGAQFIVATHSPFIVSSVKNSTVHVLRHVADDNINFEKFGFPSMSKVSSVKLDLDTRAATANEILRDVLGVPVTLPVWAEAEITAIASKFQIEQLDATLLNKLRSELLNAGLGEYFPQALNIIAGGADD